MYPPIVDVVRSVCVCEVPRCLRCRKVNETPQSPSSWLDFLISLCLLVSPCITSQRPEPGMRRQATLYLLPPAAHPHYQTATSIAQDISPFSLSPALIFSCPAYGVWTHPAANPSLTLLALSANCTVHTSPTSVTSKQFFPFVNGGETSMV